MNPEIKAQWVAALRSGEFKQGVGVLHRVFSNGPDEYCCLGVLCVLAKQAGAVQSESERYDGDSITYFSGDHGSSTYLPVAVREWAGLADRADARNPIVWGSRTLADLNDAHFSFQDIANRIEEKL